MQAKLSEEIALSRALWLRLQMRSERYLEDQVVVRYLWKAIALAEVLQLSLDAKHLEGTEPVLRAIFEVYLDLLFLESDPAPERAAARTVLAEVRNQKAMRKLDDELRSLNTDVPALEAGDLDRPTDEIVAQLSAGLPSDESKRALREAVEEMKTKQYAYWHWSRLDRVSMIEMLVKRGALTGGGAAIAKVMTKGLAGQAHGSPSWLAMEFSIGEDGQHHFKDTRDSNEEDIARTDAIAGGVMSVIRQMVEGSDIPRRHEETQEQRG